MTSRASRSVLALLLAGLPACSTPPEPASTETGGAAGSSLGTGGATNGGTAGAAPGGGSGAATMGGIAGASAGAAGSATAGASGTAAGGAPGGDGAGGSSNGGAAGSGALGGAAGAAAGMGGAGGDSAGAGGRGGAGGAGGAGGTGGAMTFTCNQVTAMTLTREWFQAGFQQDAGIIDARWQLKAREHGYITEWSNPNSDFWNEPLQSPCANGSASPDHVVLTVLSWAPACCDTQPEWEAQVTSAVTTLRAKYAGLRRIDLMTVIRGAGNMLCPTPPAAGETIVIPPELDAALAAVAAANPNLVFVAPKFEAPNCAAFSGGGPHLTTAGNTAVARDIAAYFATLQ